MKGLYIACIDESECGSGVYKKIKGQIKAFKNNKIEMDLLCKNKDVLSLNSEILKGGIIDFKLSLGKARDFFKFIYKYKKDHIKKYDFVYIRFSSADCYMFKLIKYVNSLNKKVFVEIPTYPYKYEVKNKIKRNAFDLIDNILFKNYGRYINKLVIFNNEIDKLFNIDVINTFNAVDLNENQLVYTIRNENEINLIGLANINIWHGYDRIIWGLEKYYKSSDIRIKVNFCIVGNGAERENLEKLTKRLGLEEYISFKGAKQGEELEKILCKMNIGVSSLGLHRIGGAGDPIKTKEFIARGLPVILSYDDSAVSDKLSFVFTFESNDNYIDINKLIDKYNKCDLDSKSIREFAINNLSWESQIKKIIYYL